MEPIKSKGFEGVWENVINAKDMEGVGKIPLGFYDILLALKITQNCIVWLV